MPPFGIGVCRRDWWERAVLKEFSHGEWRDNIQMSHRSLKKMCVMMERTMHPQDESVCSNAAGDASGNSTVQNCCKT